MNVRVVRSIQAIDPKTWDALCDDPVFSHGWFRALEESRVVSVEPRHLILEDDRGVVGILPCFIQHGSPYYTLAGFLFGPLAPWFHRLRFRVLPALLAFSPQGYRTQLFLASHVDRPSAVTAFTDAMARICQEENIPVSGWHFVSGWDRELAANLRSAGHTEAFLCPTASWVNHYETFEGYLDDLKHLSRRRYNTARNELNHHARSGIQLEETPLVSLKSSELAAIQSIHYMRYQPDGASPFSPAFFDALKRSLGDQVVVHTARQNGKLLSYGVVIKSTNRWHMFLSGDAADERSHADKLHFNLYYYYPIRLAIAAGTAQLRYGLSSYQTKIRRGCTMEPLHLFLRVHSPRLRYWLPVWMRFLDWWYRREHREVMAAEDRPTEPPLRDVAGSPSGGGDLQMVSGHPKQARNP